MKTPKEKLFLIPKGSNGLRLHPRAFVDENMKSYEKVTGILLSVEQIEKLEAEKKELLEALEKVIIVQDKYFGEQEIHGRLRALSVEIEILIQKHKK